MNPETHTFHPETPATPLDWTRFHEGEAHTLSGVEFVIHKITKNELRLRPAGQVKAQATAQQQGPVNRQQRRAQARKEAKELERHRKAQWKAGLRAYRPRTTAEKEQGTS
jgi:hypothetical protein